MATAPPPSRELAMMPYSVRRAIHHYLFFILHYSPPCRCTACDAEASSPHRLRAIILNAQRTKSQIVNATNRKSTLLCVPCVAFALFALKLPTIIYHLPTTIYRLMKRKGFRFSLGTCDDEASSPHRLRANSIANRKSVNRKFNLPTTHYQLPSINFCLNKNA